MDVRIVTEISPATEATPLLVLPLAQAPAAESVARGGALERLVAEARERGDFHGADGETLLLFPSGDGAPQRVLLVGTGKKPLDAERLRRVGGTAARQAAKSRVAEVEIIVPRAPGVGDERAARALAEGLVLGAYVFREMKTPAADDPEPVALSSATLRMPGADEGVAREGARVGVVAARAECLARDLGNRPPNVVTPSYLAEAAERVAREGGMTCTVLGRAELEAEGMRALLAVSTGSAQEPKLIVIEHRGAPEDAAPLMLVGKGLTFDAGGISIKPAAGMEEMKFDMSGGAAVIAAMQAIAELKLAVNVVGIVPASENLLGAAAMRPSDILTMHAGKTVEVVNTDAEGRLILADALSYAARFRPAAIVDCATLTGACIIALGHEASGLFANDDALLEEVRAAGDATGERCWPMPMFDGYREQIKSTYADIKNSGGRPAGAATAAWFLREFVGETPWAHLDIAGTAHGEGKLSYESKGSTGVPTRLLVEWVRGRAA